MCVCVCVCIYIYTWPFKYNWEYVEKYGEKPEVKWSVLKSSFWKQLYGLLPPISAPHQVRR